MARLVLAAISLLVLAAALAYDPGAHHAPPITIRLLDEEDLSKESGRLLREQIDQFTQKTGIQVETVRSVGDIRSELEIRRTLLETGPAGADVYGLISQWPPLFADDLIDLKSYVPAPEIAAHFPEIIQNYTVNGRLVAMPSAFDVEMLFYRGDLLRLYGYRRPPETWEQLEKMAARIEAGERAKGRKNFWGFLFAGARGEALTDCALEWQVPDGGGTILDNSQVTVNNEQAIRSWERAARWIGSISPPGVVVYSEWDSLNLWLEGRAAFMRGYSVQFMIRAQRSLSRVSLEIAPLPRGRARSVALFHGYAYGVSRRSPHAYEAVKLVRFLAGRDAQLRRSLDLRQPPTLCELFKNPALLAANPHFSNILEAFQKGVIFRPAAAAGKKYPEVSRAYYNAVHAVLTHEKTGAKAAADLETELVSITGLKPAMKANASVAQTSERLRK